MTIWLLIGYVISTRLAYWLLRWDWTKDFDFDRRDRIRTATISLLGPIAVMAALLVIGVGSMASRPARARSEVLIPRRKK